jgi:hypothetical protein
VPSANHQSHTRPRRRLSYNNTFLYRDNIKCNEHSLRASSPAVTLGLIGLWRYESTTVKTASVMLLPQQPPLRVLTDYTVANNLRRIYFNIRYTRLALHDSKDEMQMSQVAGWQAFVRCKNSRHLPRFQQ